MFLFYFIAVFFIVDSDFAFICSFFFAFSSETFFAFINDSESSRSWSTCRKRLVIASLDISTFFIFNPVNVN